MSKLHGVWNPEYEGTEEQRTQLLVQQWAEYLKTTSHTSQMRMNTNVLFVSLSGAIIAASGTLTALSAQAPATIAAMALAAAGMLLIYPWLQLTRFYRGLNTAKFKVIRELESKLPARPIFEGEWVHELKEGKDPATHRALTPLEQHIPFILMVAFGVLIAANGLKLVQGEGERSELVKPPASAPDR